jgi:hypothetical protein
LVTEACSVRTPLMISCVSLIFSTIELIAASAVTTRSTWSWMAAVTAAELAFASSTTAACSADPLARWGRKLTAVPCS